jgi:hypothetical protein
MFGKEAVCPDGHFEPAVFQELGYYLNSLNCPWKKSQDISIKPRDISRGLREISTTFKLGS